LGQDLTQKVLGQDLTQKVMLGVMVTRSPTRLVSRAACRGFLHQMLCLLGKHLYRMQNTSVHECTSRARMYVTRGRRWLGVGEVINGRRRSHIRCESDSESDSASESRCVSREAQM
jgi:hypothetical protein